MTEPSETGDAKEDSKDEGSGFLQLVANFDWLKVPGAVRGIAHLVLGATEAGAAWTDAVRAKGQQRAQAIRDITAARTKVTNALAIAASAFFWAFS